MMEPSFQKMAGNCGIRNNLAWVTAGDFEDSSCEWGSAPHFKGGAHRGKMTQRVWTAVDDYINRLLIAQDEGLEEAVRSSEAVGLPSIQVSPAQGKLLNLLVRVSGAARALEIGTLGGYSTIWMARALPPTGRLITLELSPKHAAVARTNFQRAGVAEKIELRQGPALDSLSQMAAEKVAPFDFIFIDANKSNMPEYFTWALNLS